MTYQIEARCVGSSHCDEPRDEWGPWQKLPPRAAPTFEGDEAAIRWLALEGPRFQQAGELQRLRVELRVAADTGQTVVIVPPLPAPACDRCGAHHFRPLIHRNLRNAGIALALAGLTWWTYMTGDLPMWKVLAFFGCLAALCSAAFWLLGRRRRILQLAGFVTGMVYPVLVLFNAWNRYVENNFGEALTLATGAGIVVWLTFWSWRVKQRNLAEQSPEGAERA